MNNKYQIFNKSSEDMSEVPDFSVDFVVFAPPYNIDTPYSDEEDYDYKSFEDFKSLLNRVIAESARVLKPGGLFFSESADTVYSKGKLIELASLIQKLAIENGLSVEERHVNFIQSKDGVVLTDKEHNWSEDYYSEEDSHSNCHQLLLMKKDQNTKFKEDKGKIFYIEYPAEEEGHPCPFSAEHIEKYLKLLNFKEGNTLLESFMGTGRMGAEVLRRGGKFIGYELEKKHYDFAKERFEDKK
jgi:DNA modification methylase